MSSLMLRESNGTFTADFLFQKNILCREMGWNWEKNAKKWQKLEDSRVPLVGHLLLGLFFRRDVFPDVGQSQRYLYCGQVSWKSDFTRLNFQMLKNRVKRKMVDLALCFRTKNTPVEFLLFTHKNAFYGSLRVKKIVCGKRSSKKGFFQNLGRVRVRLFVK